MSMRYKPVALVLKCIVFCRRVRVHLSWLVSKMPPNCLKARLENKNGVLPSTTSTPSQTFSPDEWLKGNKTLYMLVSVWLFPKRNLIWLGRCCTWDLTSLGRRCKRQLRVCDPMMHRLAPVSSMAWAHCSSLACRTGISGINSQAVSLVLASRAFMGLVLVTACWGGLHSVDTEGKNFWTCLDGLRMHCITLDMCFPKFILFWGSFHRLWTDMKHSCTHAETGAFGSPEGSIRSFSVNISMSSACIISAPS